MDLLTLHKTTYLPVSLFANYSSLVWTEKFPLQGGFELVTNEIALGKSVLAEGTLVAILQSDEIMRVDTHLLEEDEDGQERLKITGSTFDQFLRERVNSRYTKKGSWVMRREYSPPRAAAAYVWNAVVNPSTTDATGSAWTGYDYDRNLNDNLPNFSVSLALSGTYSGKKTFLEPSVVYDQLEKLLARKTLGMRTVRPRTPAGAVFQEASLDSAGAFVLTTVQKANARYEIYDGVDRSMEQTTRTPVVFRQDLGHLLQVTTLTSTARERNVARVLMPTQQETIPQTGLDTVNTKGQNWRVLLVDLTSESEPAIALGDQELGPWATSVTSQFQNIIDPAFNQSDGTTKDYKAYTQAFNRMNDIWADFEDSIQTQAYNNKVLDKMYKKMWSDLQQTAFALAVDIVPKAQKQDVKDTIENRVTLAKANSNPNYITVKQVAELNLAVFMNEKAQDALIKANRVVSVSGSSSVSNPLIFGKDYFLGDKVTVQDETGANRSTHRVTEYIRIEDENGQVEYPGLTNLTETS